MLHLSFSFARYYPGSINQCNMKNVQATAQLELKSQAAA
jgi:hypothetical protein